MRTTTFSIFVATVFALGAWADADAPIATFTVDAGDVARVNAPVAVRVPLPAGANGAVWGLTPTEGGAGRPIPAQVERTVDGTVVRWVEPELKAGASRSYQLRVLDSAEPSGFRFVDGDGWRDLAFGDKGVWRHMNRFNPADHDNTFKPFHHIYGLHDEGFITNGPGSEEWGKDGKDIRFPHHRGLFFGFNKTPYGDFWHGTNGVSQQHRGYLTERDMTGPFVAREAGVNEWITKEGVSVIRDTREVTAWRISDKELVLDFDVTVESLTSEPIPLSGDPQHAGFHFRAANEVGAEPATQPGAAPTTKKSSTGGGNAVYTRPAGAVAKGNDVWADCPWVYCAFKIKGNPYGVTEMNGPTNPAPTVFSTRAYGRFGAFFDGQSVAPNKPLKLKYRFIIRDGAQSPDAKQLDAEYQDYVSPVKVTTVK